ncbi:antitoxin VapB family protein [Halogeometricum luteum]|uniref:Antitoxin VapB family protein n=1 Tax=Halogeometricum luteum TaxID=2950537 RepID=A0ABU2G5R9_9EURY|nr:antitoxin VapB family protein [Halogeometricum sp. S3BR5-2]MDS0296142.1 antitoxin VapB family protein [Halogeometricum sp. S3BR5-2]
MTKTIRVSDEYHRYLKSHNREGETMEETLRRLTRGPDPSDLAGFLTDDEARRAKEAVKRRREGDVEKKDAAREAFSDG